MDFHEIWMSHGPDKAFNIVINYSGNDAQILIKKKRKKKKKTKENQIKIKNQSMTECKGIVQVW